MVFWIKTPAQKNKLADTNKIAVIKENILSTIGCKEDSDQKVSKKWRNT